MKKVQSKNEKRKKQVKKKEFKRGLREHTDF